MKISDVKAAVDKELEILEKKNGHGSWRKSETRIELIAKKQGMKGRNRTVVRRWWIVCHLENSELEPHLQKYKGRVVLRGDTCKRWFRIVCSIYWAGIIRITIDSCKSHWYLSRLPECAGQAADAISAYNPGQNRRCTIIVENSKNQNVQILGYVNRNTSGPNRGPAWKIQSFLLREICTVTLWQDCYLKDNSIKFYLNTVGTKFQIGNAYSLTEKKDCSCLCMWTI